jgi:hypothetical protein
MQNGSVAMTKEQYFDMCDQLGSEPVESEIPVEFDDFAMEVQLALSIYRMLRDEWEYMNGTYLGKNLNGIFELFDVYEVNPRDKKFYLELIHMIDSTRIDQIRNSKPTEKPAT